MWGMPSSMKGSDDFWKPFQIGSSFMQIYINFGILREIGKLSVIKYIICSHFPVYLYPDKAREASDD
jgi:hypothetical protein